MTFKSKIAINIGRFVRWGLTTFTRGGSSLPGKIATTIDPTVLDSLAQNYKVVVITGTNGKTLTTALTVHALQEKYPYVLTNPTGSNMQQGIVSTFLTAPKLKDDEQGVAVLEVDEGSLKHVVKALKPELFVHTNVFRDQMDRYGEIYSIYELMADAAKAVPTATVLANADSPLFNSLALPNKQLFFGFDHQTDADVEPHYNTDGILCPNCHNILNYHQLTYANLGKYYCAHCDFKRPELEYSINKVSDLSLTHSTFEIDGFPFTIPVAGLYNIYNALAAYSVARYLGVDAAQIERGFSKAERVFGRQEMISINGKQVLLHLVKNPVGLNQVLELIGLDEHPFMLVAILNNQYADGTDVSWIWDGHYEQLVNYPVQEVVVGGMKADEMKLRLTVAGLDENRMAQATSTDEIISQIENSSQEYVHILATYTAMLELRTKLKDKGYLK